MAVAVSLQLRTLPVALLKQSTAGSQFYLSEQISITPHFTMASIGPLAEATEAVLSNSSLQSLISRRDKK